MRPEVKALAPVYEDETLRITHQPGSGGLHIVSFTGVGLGVQREEWRGFLAGADAAGTFVADKARSWFNSTHDAVLQRVVPLLSGRVITLGNSMGGFGALWFASALPGCHRAIAFASQFSVHPEHWPQSDERWWKWRKHIKRHPITHALQRPSADVEYVAFYGNKRRELEHAHALAAVATERTYILVVEGTGHAVAKRLKKAGAFAPLRDLLLAQGPLDPHAIIALLAEHDFTARLLRQQGAPSCARGARAALTQSNDGIMPPVEAA